MGRSSLELVRDAVAPAVAEMAKPLPGPAANSAATWRWPLPAAHLNAAAAFHPWSSPVHFKMAQPGLSAGLDI